MAPCAGLHPKHKPVGQLLRFLVRERRKLYDLDAPVIWFPLDGLYTTLNG